eukprot:Gb_11084 [translate_table: standard]
MGPALSIQLLGRLVFMLTIHSTFFLIPARTLPGHGNPHPRTLTYMPSAISAVTGYSASISSIQSAQIFSLPQNTMIRRLNTEELRPSSVKIPTSDDASSSSENIVLGRLFQNLTLLGFFFMVAMVIVIVGSCIHTSQPDRTKKYLKTLDALDGYSSSVSMSVSDLSQALADLRNGSLNHFITSLYAVRSVTMPKTVYSVGRIEATNVESLE